MRLLVLLLILLAPLVGLSAQTSETRGTQSLLEGRKYFVAFPQVIATPAEKPLNPAMMLYVSSRVKAKIRIQTPAAINQAPRIDREFSLEPDRVLQIPISTSYMNTASESREGYGILVTGDRPISVSTYQAWFGNGELARHLPTEGWGKSYFTMNFYQDRYGSGGNYKYRPSQILVIAERDNTVVTYTPTFDTEGGRETPSVRKGQSASVTLDRGETYLIKAKIDETQNKEFTTDLSGTFISATNNIGVVSGHTKVAIMRYPEVLPPTGAFATEASFVRNNVHDVMLPIEMAGTKFVTVPCMYTPTRITGQASAEFGIDDDRGDVIRVVATQDNTTIKAMISDGTGLKNMWKINRGETRLETAVEVAMYWESDKPILMGHYGKSYAKVFPPTFFKDGDATQGHPTVEAGMPMLEVVPSIDRWTNYGTFKSPEGMDNFFNIAFDPKDVGKIKIDGKALNSAFGNSMRLLAGTPYAYIRSPIGQGDHVVESTSDSIKWTAWVYGSLDGLQQGRAYGTPVSLDLSIPCADSLIVSEVIRCGDVQSEGQIVPEGIACGSTFAVYAEELNNYDLVVDTNFSSGDPRVNFSVNVLDKMQDASSSIRVVTRSGKFVEKTYIYIADKIKWDLPTVNWGTIDLNTPVTKEFTITNLSPDRPLTIRNLTAKYFPNVYSFNPSTFTIPPAGSQQVTVTAVIQDAREKLDTVVAQLDCFNKQTVELRVRGEEPDISVSDETWTIPPGNAWHKKTVVVHNRSNVDLEIFGCDTALLNASHFRIDSGMTTLPFTISGGEDHFVYMSFNPLNLSHGSVDRLDLLFHSNALRSDSIAVLTANVDSTATSISEQLAPRISISPQPVILSQHSHINIQTPISYTQLIIINSIGQEIVRMDVREGAMQLPTSVIHSSGMYLIKLSGTTGDAVVTLMCLE